MSEDRARSRVSGHFEAELTCSGESMPVVTSNLSLKGMLCTAPREDVLSGGEGCSVRLVLSPDVALDIEARAVRVEGAALALKFEAMDVATFGHLRNLVRFASPDPDAIDEELARHLDEG